MCRLAFGNRNALTKISKKLMSDLFKELEIRQGGHGNGIACQNQDGKLIVVKGITRTANEMAEIIYKIQPDLWMFHTRLVSSGEKSDTQCHPHRCLGTDGNVYAALCENGTVPHMINEFLQKLYGGRMDTETIANALYKCEIEPLKFLDALDNSIWVLLQKDRLSAINAYKYASHGDLNYMPELQMGMSVDLFEDVQSERICGKGFVKIEKNGKIEVNHGLEYTNPEHGYLFPSYMEYIKEAD